MGMLVGPSVDVLGDCPVCGEPHARPGGHANCWIERLTAERDAWVRRFNRLEAAISHHKKGKSAMFVDEVDEALYAARDRILRDASREGNDGVADSR